MASLIRSVSFDMLAIRIFNESDHLTYAQVRQIIRQMEKEMCACIMRREPLEIEGLGSFTVGEQYMELAGRDCEIIKFHPDNGLKIIVKENLTPESKSVCIRFTPAECDEIRRKILSGEATIKGTARSLNAAVKTIQKIVRNQPPQTEEEKGIDNE